MRPRTLFALALAASLLAAFRLLVALAFEGPEATNSMLSAFRVQVFAAFLALAIALAIVGTNEHIHRTNDRKALLGELRNLSEALKSKEAKFHLRVAGDSERPFPVVFRTMTSYQFEKSAATGYYTPEQHRLLLRLIGIIDTYQLRGRAFFSGLFALGHERGVGPNFERNLREAIQGPLAAAEAEIQETVAGLMDSLAT